LKNGDAKLKGLMFKDDASQLPNTILCGLCKSIEEVFFVLVKNVLLWGKYYYHVFQYRHMEMMQNDCLCEELKCELKVKSLYHNSKAIELGARI
jgi:hypothetical protein